MEEKGKEADFKFISYRITEAIFKVERDADVAKDFLININLNAVTPPHASIPTLSLVTKIRDKNDKMNINIALTGWFKMEGGDKNTLNKFLAFNAPAILFPYVRAYVSSMTAQAGMQPVVLPTINLRSIGENLFKGLNES